MSQTENIDKSIVAYLATMDHLLNTHPEIAQSIIGELKAQRQNLKLIASENYSSLSVQLAMGNILTDKYAEGYAGRRFYAGCENVDAIENLADDYLKKLFNVDHAYCQPHSGADANLVAFLAILSKRVQIPFLEKKETKLDALSAQEFEELREAMVSQRILGMGLSSGGHLTHGYRHNISSKLFSSFTYEVDPKTGLLDYDTVAKRAKEVRPLVIIAGYSAYSRLLDFSIFKQIAEDVGATLMVDMAHFAGLVAAKAVTGNQHPGPFADVITSTTHKTLRGPRGGIILCTDEYKEVVDRGCPMVLGGPLPHVMAAKAIAFKEALTPDFQAYGKQVIRNAQALAESLMKQGVKVITGGTDNHIVIFDVFSSFGLTGRQAELALKEAHITVNRNTIPGETQGAWYTSGIRVGTPALTTLGMKETEMEKVALWIVEILKNTKPNKPGGQAKFVTEENLLAKTQREIQEMLQQFPLYPELKLD